MMEIALKVKKISEGKPVDGAICWVNPVASYQQQLVYNAEYNCWDDSEGDDYAYDVNSEDIYVELPNLYKICKQMN